MYTLYNDCIKKNTSFFKKIISRPLYSYLEMRSEGAKTTNPRIIQTLPYSLPYINYNS